MRKIIIIVIAGIIIVGSVVAIILFRTAGPATTAGSQDQKTVTVRTDPDTGEQTTDNPNIAASESQDSTDVTVLGLADFITATSITRTQVLYLHDALQNYDSTVLKNKYRSLTIRPQDTVVNDQGVTGTIRLGDSNATVAFRYDGVSGGSNLQITITDTGGKNGGNFSSQPQPYFEDD